MNIFEGFAPGTRILGSTRVPVPVDLDERPVLAERRLDGREVEGSPKCGPVAEVPKTAFVTDCSHLEGMGGTWSSPFRVMVLRAEGSCREEGRALGMLGVDAMCRR